MCKDNTRSDNIFDYLTKKKVAGNFQSLIIDCKYKKTPLSTPMSIELKISIATFSNETCLIFIFRDTTARDTIAMLEGDNAYKDKLLASVSHELRTPLNGNMNLIDCAILDPAIPQKVKDKFLIPAVRSGKLLLHIINDILDYSQMQANSLKLVFTENDLKKGIEDAVQLVELQAARKGIQLIFECDNSIPTNFQTDHNRVSQIALNLLSNALKFTFKGCIKCVVEKLDSNVRISISDTGIGISPENQKKLFGMYTKLEYENQNEINPRGVGLGLSISNMLAQILGPPNNVGITVSSVPGIGSTFSFFLCERTGVNQVKAIKKPKSPRSAAGKYQSECASPVSEGVSSLPLHSTKEFSTVFELTKKKMITSFSDIVISTKKCECPKILAVDDDGFNIMAMESILGVLGYSCVASYNGYDAIEKFFDRLHNPCCEECTGFKVIFMDCSMPVIDGMDTTKELRSRMEAEGVVGISIIGCTAYTSEQQLKDCIEAGMDDVTLKPLEKAKLASLLTKILPKD
jgi:CheY-like chemotaxis protein/nitrogen-specific signal transduction histidine kinase